MKKLDDIYNVYEPVIGLEIHTQLLTQSKMFCGCANHFGDAPNTNICPICTGQPGVLPVLNQKAVEFGIMVGLALDCRIEEYSQFARKNYFYPDLPKAYQISMYELPIATEGFLEIESDHGSRKVRIIRVHMEEDAGKLVHLGSERLGGSTGSLVDLNRSCTPLLEIVSYPDMHTPEEAKSYVQELRSILIHLGVSDGNMEEGSLRCDANISLRKKGAKELGIKAEIKNMNSFRSIQQAIASEIIRQASVLEEGGRIIQETRHFDDATGETISMRSKEEAHDYRYFPDPDLVPLHISKEWRDEIAKSMGELPRQKRKRYVEDLKLSHQEAYALCLDPSLARFFDDANNKLAKPKAIANWLLGDISAYLNAEKVKLSETRLTTQNLVELIELIEKGNITGKVGKSLIPKMLQSGKSPQELVHEEGLTQISDSSALTETIQKVISQNPKSVADFKSGKETAITFLIGQTMKATRGRANPQAARDILLEELKKA